MTWRGDVDRIYGRRPKTLFLPHLITLQYYSLLRFFVLKLATTSGSLRLCREIKLYIISWLCQNLGLSNLVLNVLVVLADNALRQTVPCIHHPISNPNFSILHAVACRTVTNQSLFATRFANCHFHCQISQIWRFSKAFGSENDRLILNSEKHLATVFVTSWKFRK